MKNKRTALIMINDLHAGSNVSVMVNNHSVHGDETAVSPNKLQRTLNRHYKKAAAMVAALDVDRRLYCLVGDMTDGIHHGTIQNVAADESDHAMIAIDNIDWFLQNSGHNDKTDKIYTVAGTETHTGKRHKLEDHIGRDLGSVPYRKPTGYTVHGAPKGGWFVWPRLLWNINGKNFMIQHHPPAGTGKRLHTAMNQLRAYYRDYVTKAALRKWAIPDYVFCAHYHVKQWEPVGMYQVLGYEHTLDLNILPAWQAQTDFVTRIDQDAVATIGMVAAVVDTDGSVTKHESIIKLGAPKYEQV